MQDGTWLSDMAKVKKLVASLRVDSVNPADTTVSHVSDVSSPTPSHTNIGWSNLCPYKSIIYCLKLVKILLETQNML